ncbi:MAG: ATP-binding protein [Cyclobacteriaceae bacterium]
MQRDSTNKIKKLERLLEVEALLERVRSQAMAMRKSSDLLDIVVTMRKEFTSLGHEAGYFWHMRWLKDTYEKAMTSGDGSRIGMVMELPRHFHENPAMIRWEKNKKPVAVFPYDVDGAIDYVDKMIKTGRFEEIDPNAPGPDDIKAIGGITFIMARTTHGEIGYSLPGEVPNPPKDALDTLVRFAKVFDLAYRRFEDLRKAENQTRETEIELALERVRAETMAMHSSDHLLKVIKVISKQLVGLGIKFTNVSFGQLDNNDDYHFWFSASKNPEPVTMNVPYFDHPMFQRLMDAKKKKLDFFADTQTKKEHTEWIRFVLKHNKFEGLKKEDRSRMLNRPVARSVALMPNIFLVMTNYHGVQFTDSENQILRRFSKVFEQAYTRFLDLQKAEEQAREAQIEAALERVRARSMAMYDSNELQEVINLLFDQLLSHGVGISSALIASFNENIKDGLKLHIAARGQKYSSEFHIPYINNPAISNLAKSIKEETTFYTERIAGKKKNELVRHLFKNSTIDYNNEQKDYVLRAKAICRSIYRIGKLGIVIERYLDKPFNDAENVLLRRFGKVFEQTYTRFLDLKKAEEQAREAQIETSLERVRASAMAMRSSDELADLIVTIFQELQKLDMELTRCLLWIFNAKDKSATTWMANSEDPNQADSYHVPYHDNPAYRSLLKGWQTRREKWEYDLKGNIKDRWDKVLVYDYFKSLPSKVKKAMKDLDRVILSGSFNKYGVIQTASPNPLSDENQEILLRFSQVFEQNYTRFLDLKRAEEQAREAQIEASLERVRASAMAMHNSTDVEEATAILFSELENLGVETLRCGVSIIREEKVMQAWTASNDTEDRVLNTSGDIDMTIHPVFKGLFKNWKEKESTFSFRLQGKSALKYYKALESNSASKQSDYKLPMSHVLTERHYGKTFIFEEGCLFAFSKNEFSKEDDGIFQRFAKVFALTYRRYLDLIAAEKRALDAVKTSSLDRVRAEIASMRSTSDLDRITPLIWRELKALGVPFFRCGVFIIDENTEQVNMYLSTPDGKPLAALNLDFDEKDIPLVAEALSHWRTQTVHKAHWSQKKFAGFTKKLVKRGLIKNQKKYQQGERAPEDLHLHQVPFKQGMLYIGNSEPLNDEQIELVQSLANAFSVAYSRYEDFVKLEEAKKAVENTLSDLKSAQTQLIHSEKMASLGELTAGIAHEIQNPLNFVNNFSEINKELIEELKDAVAQNDQQEVEAILKDLSDNEQKVSHHGKRAEGIVKSMLAHSRTTSNVKEPTDINALADEYLRLAYHGLRAKDKSFNADFKAELDDNLPKVNVVAQDIGRVLLNLINNAFHAVSDRQKMVSNHYQPTVTISTKLSNSKSGGDAMLVSVKDNGNGIPEDIQEKIFQPFFTTKPTGEGTGLGLSMSYDIITKGHGGKINVKSEYGLGTEFIVELSV